MGEVFRLFDLKDRPLDLKFPKIFFQEIPSNPGTYFFKNKDGDILYVGKARDLKKRLTSYRHASPDKTSKRILQMLRLTETINWEICESEKAALLQENQLIRKLRPPFNIINAHPENYMFIWLKVSGLTLEFRLTTQPNPEENGALFIYGCFKGRGILKLAYSALLRRLWLKARADRTAIQIPAVLTRDKPPYRYTIDFEDEVEFSKALRASKRFLGGISKKNLLDFSSTTTDDQAPATNGFLNYLLNRDRDFLTDFFQYGPRRNRLMIQKFARIRLKSKKGLFIFQDEIDDWIVEHRLDP